MAKKKEDENILIEENILTIEDVSTPQIETKEEKQPKKKITKVVCNVLNTTASKVYIDFNGSGIMFPDRNPNKTSKVEISYEGDFGQKTFSILSHKYI